MARVVRRRTGKSSRSTSICELAADRSSVVMICPRTARLILDCSSRSPEWPLFVLMGSPDGEGAIMEEALQRFGSLPCPSAFRSPDYGRGTDDVIAANEATTFQAYLIELALRGWWLRPPPVARLLPVFRSIHRRRAFPRRFGRTLSGSRCSGSPVARNPCRHRGRNPDAAAGPPC